jgi:hypothetical protein
VTGAAYPKRILFSFFSLGKRTIVETQKDSAHFEWSLLQSLKNENIELNDFPF